MDYIIETDFEGPGFVAVPNHVAQRRGLSPDALGVLVYLASQPRGFIARWSAVCAHFGMGKDRWQRIARELRVVGAMDAQPIRGARGRVIGRCVSVRWPRPPVEVEPGAESREIPLSDRKPGKPAAGKSAKSSREIRQVEPENPAPYKDERKTHGAKSRATASRRSPPDGGGGSPVANGDVAPLPDVAALSAFQRDQIRRGASLTVAGRVVPAVSVDMLALQRALRLLERGAVA